MLKKRIPTIIGLILLIIGAVSGVIFINQGTDFLPRAAPEYVPQKIKITNITDTSFVVSWVTKEPTIGFLRYSDSVLNLSETATDDRDQLAGSSSDYRTHYITLQNLTPGAKYYFKLGSQKNQLYDDNGDPFEIALPQSLPNNKETDTAFGSVVTAVDTPAEGAIIYISLPNATPLSALVKQNGSWAVNLAMARSSDLTQAISYDPTTTRIDLLVQTDDSDPTTAVTTTANDQPVPTITIGQTNNFVNSSSQSTSTNPSPSPSSTNEQNQDNPTQASKFSLKPILVTDDTTLAITSLPNDGIISSSQPEFSGTAPANTKITINVHSPSAQTTQILTDQTGSWSWLVETPLEAGDHTITISYVDSSGNVHSVEQYFVIDSTQLQQVDLSYTATPAAATPTPTPKATPTPTPTTMAVATPTPTPKPTPTPTPTSTATSAAILVAGNVEPSLVMVLLGLLFVGFGAYVVAPAKK